jgi:hypothetical protein
MFKKLFAESSIGMEPDPGAWDDDPVAQKVEWTPQNSGGASFRTHCLEVCGVARMEFRLTLGARLFCLLFVGAGAVVPSVALFHPVRGGTSDLTASLVVACVGAVFLGTGFALLHFMSKPRVFDKLTGRYWKGRQDPQLTRPRFEPDDSVALSDIHALQLLSEHVRGNKSSYTSYELNLVLENGRRVNVTDHGSVKALREDTRELARFLDVPVWDAA